MRRVLWQFLTISLLSIPVFAQQPSEALVQAGIDAFNSHNPAYFEKALAPDVIWLDEDGHVIAGKEKVLGFVTRKITATPPRTVTAANIKVSSSGEVAWASFSYTIEGEGRQIVKGMNSTVYKKSGSDWQIVLVHGSVDTKIVLH